jgi:FkbM family methyltransferase
MSFISYAQNYEDVMLWRALKHIENGFYIDAGAAWPDEHSVTKAFYDRGWRGINIEPNPVHYASLIEQRTRDINLQLAIGERAGQLTMNLVGDTGLSTLDTGIADQHKDGGWGIVQQTVSVDTLASVCARHLPTGQEVHFLKVDVEGFEEQALRSYNWKEFRPWIVLVEATLPMTQQESYESWEPILLGADYIFAYADGLNRYYVAKAHAKLALELKYPPNVFDGFLLIDQEKAEAKAQQAEDKAQQAEAKAQQAEAKAQQAEAKAQQAEDKAQQAEAKAQQAEAKAQQAEAKAQQAIDQAKQAQSQAQAIASQLDSIYTSRSWRLTAPLRQLVNILRSFKQT